MSPLMFRSRRVVPPPEPDPAVFGDWHPSRDYGGLLLWCGRCDVKWAYEGGYACWNCEGDG